MAVGSVVRMDGCFEIHPQFLLRWEASQDAYVLLYPEGIVKLNQTAGEILRRCTGKMLVRDIVAELEQLYPDAEADIARSVGALLEAAHAKGWIRPAA
jgi:pyrroloquinoline quinone biosynthesis protein D